MAEPRVELGPVESIETTCFGQEEDHDWSRPYTVYNLVPPAPTDDGTISGHIHYVVSGEGMAIVDVDYEPVPDEFAQGTRAEVWGLFTDDTTAAEIVLAALPSVLKTKEGLLALKQRREARRTASENDGS